MYTQQEEKLFAGESGALYLSFNPPIFPATKVVNVVDGRHGDLEARVARLERLLNQVLTLVQEMKAEEASPQQPVHEEVHRAAYPGGRTAACTGGKTG